MSPWRVLLLAVSFLQAAIIYAILKIARGVDRVENNYLESTIQDVFKNFAIATAVVVCFAALALYAKRLSGERIKEGLEKRLNDPSHDDIHS